jgi:hypothetical protein
MLPFGAKELSAAIAAAANAKEAQKMKTAAGGLGKVLHELPRLVS